MVTDWKQFRARFPALQRQVWVNAAASSPLPLPVHEVAHSHLDDLLLHGDRNVGAWLAGVQQTRLLLARILGGAPEEVAFTPRAPATR
ncbi:hypothetical protein [Vulgatibacter sp.]|uniref:hypothetical protein n=1 Tax=Vulgatibacter sp. TaxID=1971226 RepID=UPI00356957CC